MGKYFIGLLKAAFLATVCIIAIVVIMTLIMLFPIIAVCLVLLFLWVSFVAIFLEEDKINDELKKDKQ